MSDGGTIRERSEQFEQQLPELSDVRYYFISRTVFVRFSVEGVHRYSGASGSTEFLKHPHRHIFHVEIEIGVFGDDRELEFIDFKQKVSKYVNDLLQPTLDRDNWDKDMIGYSCEHLAKTIGVYLLNDWPKRSFKISVSEDDENGARLEYTILPEVDIE